MFFLKKATIALIVVCLKHPTRLNGAVANGILEFAIIAHQAVLSTYKAAAATAVKLK